MKIGYCIHAKTHAKFLNQVLKKDYKAWMKSGYPLTDGKIIWMVQLGDFISKSGWINQLTTPKKLKEKHINLTFDFQHNTYKNAIETGQYFNCCDRVVFDIIKSKSDRMYVFRGVFRLNKEESTSNENVWDLIQDEYNLY